MKQEIKRIIFFYKVHKIVKPIMIRRQKPPSQWIELFIFYFASLNDFQKYSYLLYDRSKGYDIL